MTTQILAACACGAGTFFVHKRSASCAKLAGILNGHVQLLKLSCLTRLARCATVHTVLAFATSLAADTRMRAVLVLVLPGGTRRAVALFVQESCPCKTKLACVRWGTVKCLNLSGLTIFTCRVAILRVPTLAACLASHAWLCLIRFLILSRRAWQTGTFFVYKLCSRSTKIASVLWGAGCCLELSCFTRFACSTAIHGILTFTTRLAADTWMSPVLILVLARVAC